MKSLHSLLLSIVFFSSYNLCHAAYPKKNIIAIAQAMVDISVECQDDQDLYQYTQGTAKKGDSVVIDEEHVRTMMEKVTAPLKQSAGGSGANVMAGISSLGGKTAIIFARGDDYYGNLFADDIKKFGVDHFTTILDDITTGVVYSFITKTDGERTMLAAPGASHYIRSLHRSIDIIKDYDMILSEGYMWYSEHAAKIVTDTFSQAKQHDIKRVFTLCSPHVVSTFREQFNQLLTNVDILVGNEEEFFTLCQTDNLDTVYATMQAKIPMTVITRAEHGVTIITPDQIIEVPVEDPVSNVVDTTGAGDIFLAGFLYGQNHEMSIKDSARLGNALAGKVIQQIGARPEFDTREVLQNLDIKSSR